MAVDVSALRPLHGVYAGDTAPIFRVCKVGGFLRINKFNRDGGYQLNLQDGHSHGQAAEVAPRTLHPINPVPERGAATIITQDGFVPRPST